MKLNQRTLLRNASLFSLVVVAGSVSISRADDGGLPKTKKRVSGLPPEGYTDTVNVPGQKWRVHDKERPEPGIVDPGQPSTQDRAGSAPSDAVVLFDGKDLTKWVGGDGKDAKWKVENGYAEVNGGGSIRTKQGFGSCQLHVEWASPAEVKGKSQGRGNSGVMIMGFYEIQVLDSFDNRTYSDGQAGSIYGQYPPLVNASRKPGDWQTYDIIFEAPQFEGDKLKTPGHITVIHNGVLVHHRTKILGRVAHQDPPVYKAHKDALPLVLQDHGNPVRFRNIWIRRLNSY
ncbi:MAG: DUF1080 domain-containing protein, partial [Pirellulaceae bacterium]|nr:DUF1080 domain-containing protein [Pirellulaceae bacterium]